MQKTRSLLAFDLLEHFQGTLRCAIATLQSWKTDRSDFFPPRFLSCPAGNHDIFADEHLKHHILFESHDIIGRRFLSWCDDRVYCWRKCTFHRIYNTLTWMDWQGILLAHFPNCSSWCFRPQLLACYRVPTKLYLHVNLWLCFFQAIILLLFFGYLAGLSHWLVHFRHYQMSIVDYSTDRIDLQLA